MKLGQSRFVQIISPRVFRAIRPEGRIRANACRHQGAQARLSSRRLCFPESVAFLQRQLDREANQLLRLRLAQPARS